MPFTNTLKSSISTHAPHARRGIPAVNFRCLVSAFLLTRLMRGAAGKRSEIQPSERFLLTRLMRGAAMMRPLITGNLPFLLTRLMRGAAELRSFLRRSQPFLLTRLMRGAAPENAPSPFYFVISTHAPHARRGGSDEKLGEIRRNFYSRASCEARRSPTSVISSLNRFLLTRLMRGAAQSQQIHLPLL